MIDSHSHIYMDRYAEDRPAVIQRAVDAGIVNLLQVGCNLPESREVIALAEKVPGIYASVGVHPHDADTVTPSVLDDLAALISHPKVLSWGEIGLDFYYDNSPRETQMAAFEAQLQRAAGLDVPVVIHTRDAEDETRTIMKANPIERGGQVHCFTGTGELAADLVDMGYHIGFTGIITFKNAAALREVVAATPMDRILIETDSPYLAPVPHRGKRNEPAFVADVASAVAKIKNRDIQEVIAITTANFRRLYGCDRVDWETLAAAC